MYQNCKSGMGRKVSRPHMVAVKANYDAACEWCKENIKHDWQATIPVLHNLQSEGFAVFFEDANDAMRFRLVWDNG